MEYPWVAREGLSDLRLADLVVAVLPRAYADGRLLALEVHAVLAAAGGPERDEYLPAWRRLLSEAATVCRAQGETELAEGFMAGAQL